jgi:hypothetical protein
MGKDEESVILLVGTRFYGAPRPEGRTHPEAPKFPSGEPTDHAVRADIIEYVLSIREVSRSHIYKCIEEAELKYIHNMIQANKCGINKALVIEDIDKLLSPWKNEYIVDFFNNGRSMNLTTFICMNHPILMPPEFRINTTTISV